VLAIADQRFELVGNDLEIEVAGGTLSVDLAVITGGDGSSLDAHDGDPIDALYVDDHGDLGIGIAAIERTSRSSDETLL